MTQKLYGFGQTLRSVLPIPGALPVGDDSGISIEAGEVPPNGGPFWRRDGDAVVYDYTEVVRFRCEAKRIVADVAPSADPALVSELLVANALPATLWQQNCFMLHASGVVLPATKRAVAIAGPSGAGKSSAARALLDHGAELLGDDCIAVDTSCDYIAAAGLPGGVFEPIAPDRMRRFWPAPPLLSCTFAELGAVIILGNRGAEFALERASPLRAIELLLAQQHRPEIPALLGLREGVLAQAALLARAVPVAIWTRADGSAELTMDEMAALSRLSSETGMVR